VAAGYNLLLEHGHVVAYGGRRDAELVPLDQGPAADRFLVAT